MTATQRQTIRRRAAYLRGQIAEIAANVDSMQDTYQFIGDAYGWDDPRLPALDRDLDAAEATQTHLTAQLRALRATLAA